MDILLESLQQRFPNLQCHLFDSLGSTSDYLMQHKHEIRFPSLCYTQNQLLGRGTFNKVWDSTSDSLTFSLALSIQKPIHELTALSVLVGLATLKCLKMASPAEELYFKWPNDIYSSDGKVAGILIEVLHNRHQSTSLSIGIGINLNSVDNSNQDINDVPRASLHGIDKLALLEILIEHLLKLSRREHFLLSDDELQYAALNDFFQQYESVQLLIEEGATLVTYQGINSKGECHVVENGQIVTLQSIQHSLRKQNKE